MKKFFTLIAATSCILFTAKSNITPQSTPTQVCQDIFTNLYEFNYSLQPDDPGTAYNSQLYRNDLPLCGNPIIDRETFTLLTQNTTRMLEYQLSHPNIRWPDQLNAVPLIKRGEAVVLAQAIIVDPRTVIVSMGDYHANAHSFARNITTLSSPKFNLANEHGELRHNVLAVTKGDLGDRGHHSVETLSLAMAFKRKNMRNAFFLQGNHENPDIFSFFGFRAEIQAKYHEPLGPGEYELFKQEIAAGSSPEEVKALFSLFSYLPQVLFIGTPAANGEIIFIQFCHAGLNHESSVAARKFLEQVVRAPHGSLCCQVFPPNCTQALTWNGFYASQDPNAEATLKNKYNPELLVLHGRTLMNELAVMSQPGSFRVCAIDRGHDHLELGINQLKYDQEDGNPKTQHWTPISLPTAMKFTSEADGFPVFTGTSCPEGYGTDAFAVITFDAENSQWVITPHRLAIPYADPHANPLQKYRWKTVPTQDGFVFSDVQPIETE